MRETWTLSGTPPDDASAVLAELIRTRGLDAAEDPAAVHDALSAALPTAPETVEVLVTACQAGAVRFLRTQMALGLGATFAVQTAAGQVRSASQLDQSRAYWAVEQFAAAMGVPLETAERPPPSTGLPETSAPAQPPPTIAPPLAAAPEEMTQDRGADQGGRRIPGYSRLGPQGRGATSVVYRAHDDSLDRWVAIKVLLVDDPNDPARKRFKREGQITAQLGRHPNIVQVLATGIDPDGSPFVVMDLYDESVADRVRERGPFDFAETAEVGIRIADALATAHAAKVLHRDVKPHNILLSGYGPALADFGIARVEASLEYSQSLEQLTPMHAPPEILAGDSRPTAQGDIYSLGSTLYTMLAGHPPFAVLGRGDRQRLEFERRVRYDAVPPLNRPDVPDWFWQILVKAMAKDPADRFASAAEMRDAIRNRSAVGSVGSTGAPPLQGDGFAGNPFEPERPPRPPLGDDDNLTTVRQASPGWWSRYRVYALSGMAVVVIAVVAILVLGGGSAGGKRNPPTTTPLSLVPSQAATDIKADDLGSSVRLSWDDSTHGQATYLIVTIVPGATARFSPVPQGQTSFTVTGLSAGVQYCFVIQNVVAANALGVEAICPRGGTPQYLHETIPTVPVSSSTTG